MTINRKFVMLAMYAVAELKWPAELRTFPKQGRFCTPAHFESDQESDWSLFVWLDKPAQSGESVMVPVTPLVTESAEKLLRPEAKFRLRLGRNVFANGRIVSVVQTSEADLKCVFHFC